MQIVPSRCWIISSARESTDDENKIPSVLAVLRLIANSYFRRCLQRTIGRFLALEDTINIAGGLAIKVDRIGAVTDYATVSNEETERVSIPCCQRNAQVAIVNGSGDAPQTRPEFDSCVNSVTVCSISLAVHHPAERCYYRWAPAGVPYTSDLHQIDPTQ